MVDLAGWSSSPVQDYRIYCLDDEGHIGFADWIAAQSDQDAMRQARELRPHAHRCEVWLQNQLIAKLNGVGEFELHDA